MKFLSLSLIAPLLVLNCASLVACDGNPGKPSSDAVIDWPSWLAGNDDIVVAGGLAESIYGRSAETSRETTDSAPKAVPVKVKVFDPTDPRIKQELDRLDSDFMDELELCRDELELCRVAAAQEQHSVTLSGCAISYVGSYALGEFPRLYRALRTEAELEKLAATKIELEDKRDWV
ncbi:MAG TPA: hypothetical protein VJJ83_00450, partial [Candidatus Babeliales bacterium]|nr:hypothetical protein [Candidatus Babeliales bacterium]